MNRGDLIKFDCSDRRPGDERILGIAIGFDNYYSGGDRCNPAEPLVEVLWNTGETGWILKKRVKVMNE
jgi:hypothetical protein